MPSRDGMTTNRRSGLILPFAIERAYDEMDCENAAQGMLVHPFG